MTDLTVNVADGVALLTLNRPERRNAYTAQMGELLNLAYRDCDNDDGVRAIVLTGAGDAFCVGADFEDRDKSFRHPHRGLRVHGRADRSRGVRTTHSGYRGGQRARRSESV